MAGITACILEIMILDCNRFRTLYDKRSDLYAKDRFYWAGYYGQAYGKNLLKAGYKLVVYDINKQPVKELWKQAQRKGFHQKMWLRGQILLSPCRPIYLM